VSLGILLESANPELTEASKMKKLICVLVLLATGSLAVAEPWPTVHWPVPEVEMIEADHTTVARQLQYVCLGGGYLWTAFGGTVYGLGASGDVAVQWQVVNGCIQDIAWDGTHLWVVDSCGQMVRQFATTGSELAGWAIPEEFLPFPTGLAWDGSHLWLTSETKAYIGRFTTGGAWQATIDADTGHYDCHKWGMDFAGGVLRVVLSGVRYRRPTQIWQYDLSGNLLSKIAVGALPFLVKDKVCSVCNGTGIDPNPCDYPLPYLGWEHGTCWSCMGDGLVTYWDDNYLPPLRDVYVTGGEYYTVRWQPEKNVYKLGARPAREPRVL